MKEAKWFQTNQQGIDPSRGGEPLCRCPYRIVLTVWNGNEVSELWKTGVVMILIHKKGSKLVCENFRGICRLNSEYKIFSTILFDRLSVYAVEITVEYQSGFREGRLTFDQIFTVL